MAAHLAEPRGPELHPTKIRILDAAEELFAARGYHGVSIRDITQAAGVEAALAHYHFGPKEELFRHVVARRVDEHCNGLLNELECAQRAAPNGVASVEDVVRAFCRFSFIKTTSADPGWKRYLQLLARTAQLPMYEPVLAPLNKPYGVIVQRYTEALRAALPTIRPGNLATAFYMLQGIVSRLLAETELLERQSRGQCRAADFESHLERLVPFVAGGFYALAGQPELGGRPSAPEHGAPALPLQEQPDGARQL
jgi:AcrR family transcriptional regulator